MQRIDGTKVTMATPIDKVVANIALANARGLLQVHELSDWREGMPIAIVGGGPSLHETIDELRGYQNVMVCGSAHDWLIEAGVKPRWCVVCDPDPIMAEYLTKPNQGTTYLVASQCGPEIFDALTGQNVVLWHCGGNSADASTIWGDKPTVLVGGGCTIGTRAIFMAISFGFSDIHLFGFDNCVRKDQHHAYEFATAEETIGEITPFRLGGPEGREFLMVPYMLGQLFDFQNTLKLLGHRARFTAHGDGALAELMRLGREAAQQRKAA